MMLIKEVEERKPPTHQQHSSTTTTSQKRRKLQAVPRNGSIRPEKGSRPYVIPQENRDYILAMWCGDWSELPQDSIRMLGAQNGPVQEDATSLLYTLGSHQDRNSHLVRLACLGPYLFGSTFFSKDCEVWARSAGIYFDPSKLVDSNMSAEVREAIMVLDTLAYHISFVLDICNMSRCTPSTTLHMAEKHKTFLRDFDKEAHYSTVRSMVEASDFFRLFRKKLTTSLGEEQILACFMIALKVSLAHCHGALDTMLTYIREKTYFFSGEELHSDVQAFCVALSPRMPMDYASEEIKFS
ncbi:hypothetical protein MRX96_054425 [Rhipicephalus microplus]